MIRIPPTTTYLIVLDAPGKIVHLRFQHLYIIGNAHAQQPAHISAKTAGKPLKFHLGNGEATPFTKSTTYGKLLEQIILTMY